MVKDSKTGDFGNYDFSRKNQNFEWKTTLKYSSLKLKKTLGDLAFSSAAPNLWNNLPLHIRLDDNFERFKSLLKRHLFRLAFVFIFI